MKKTSDKSNQYLSQSVQLEEFSNPRIIRRTVMTVSSTVLLFTLWAGFTNINEVARTPGEVVPSQHHQIVQHLEGGIIRAINVSEGQAVRKGEKLLEIDGAGAIEDLERAKSKQASLAMQEERLRSYIQGRPADFSAFDEGHRELVQDQVFFSQDMIRARQEEENVIREQIRQKSEMIRSLQSELATAQSNYKIAEQLFSRRTELHDKGHLSGTRYLEYRQDFNAIKGDMAQIKTRIAMATSEKSEYETRLQLSGAADSNAVNERLDTLVAEKSQNAELIQKLQDRVSRLAIHAPAAGIIKSMTITTIGAVARPGETLLEIVPTDGDLIAEVKIPPQHIARLKIGQDVKVKLSAYDFSRYGLVEGTLGYISASTFAEERGERFYQGRIALKNTYVGKDPQNFITPGMTVMAEIVTGEKTILQYLLKPIHNSLKTAFSER